MFLICLSVALDHEEIKKDPQRITKIKRFIIRYNWEGIISKKDEWKKFERNNWATGLNVLHDKKEKHLFCLCFKTKFKSWETDYSSNDSKWRKMTSSCVKKAISIIKRSKYFCNVVMPSEDTKILEFNHFQKPDKAPFIIYADFESSAEKIGKCRNNLENYSQQK